MTRGEHDEFVEKLKRARAWCARQYQKRREDRRYEHPSFLAKEVLEEADKKFALESFGAEGWADEANGRYDTGVNYLNFGDTYTPTVAVTTTRNSCTFRFLGGGWGQLTETGFR